MQRTSKYTTLNGAASFLEVNKQTIKNYVANGLIRTIGQNNAKRFLWEDIEKLAKPNGVVDTEKNIRKYLKGIQKRNKEVLTEYLESAYVDVSGLHRCNLYARRLMGMINERTGLEDDDIRIFTLLLHGVNAKDIAKDYSITPEAIRYRGRKAIEKINETIENGLTASGEVDNLKRRVARQKNLIKVLQKELSAKDKDKREKVSKEVIDKLDMKVQDMNLSIRAKHGLSNLQVCTLGDLIEKTVLELRNARNLGKKTVAEILDYLKENFNIELK